MANKSTIEWTQITWNPVRGCTKISPGCKNCYASAFAERFRGVAGHPYGAGFDLRTVPEKMLEPFDWSKPRTVFVNSMSDLFHPEIPEAFLVDVVQVMAATPWHTYQVLTKRAERLKDLLSGPLSFAADRQNIWWGVSVEDVKYGLPRVEHLRESSAGLKFLSVEPLLEDIGQPDLKGIDWVIVGGESGVAARPIDPTWVENVRLSCEAAKVPFFFKQWGGRNKKAAGRMLHGRTFDEMPAVATSPLPEKLARARLKSQFAERYRADDALIKIEC